MNLINKKFNFHIPITQKKVNNNETDDEKLILTGTAATTSKDLQNERLDKTVIGDIKKQLEKPVTIFDSHEYKLDDVYGVVTGVPDSPDDVLSVDFEVISSKKAKIEELREKNIPLGLSIGGIVLDSTQNGDTNIIKSVRLLEISLTPLPANLDTLGTIKTKKKTFCSGDLCSQIYQSIQKNSTGETVIMEDKSMNKEEIQKMIDENLAKTKNEEYIQKMVDEKLSKTESGIQEVKNLLDKVVGLISTTKAKDEEEDKEKEDAKKSVTRGDVEEIVTDTLKKAFSIPEHVGESEAEVEDSVVGDVEVAVKKALEDLIRERKHTKKNWPQTSVGVDSVGDKTRVKSLREHGELIAKRIENTNKGHNPVLNLLNRN